MGPKPVFATPWRRPTKTRSTSNRSTGRPLSGGRPADAVPEHVAIVMDGNGRWANGKGLTRIEGHKAGEAALLDVVAGAIQIGVKHLSVYAFSTENWKRSPDEVRFLMGFNRDVLHRRRDQLNDWGVRVRWAGRKPRLWRSVIDELQFAERLTARQSTLTLTMCVNYGGRTELQDAVRGIADEVAAGRLKPSASRRRRSSATCTRTSSPTSTCSCGRRASSAPRTSSSGSPHTPSSCSSTRSGRTSRGPTSGRPSSSTPAAPAASAARSTRRASDDARPAVRSRRPSRAFFPRSQGRVTAAQTATAMTA